MNIADHPELSIASGALRGRNENGLQVFRGIPFACPPVGPLRFAAPQPVLPWVGVFEADVFGPPPPQSAVLGPTQPWEGDDKNKDNWLTINVWSPASGGAALPVMVWIYGGAYMVGHASEPTYDGAKLAAQGVVVVTFNHRVGVEGFAQIEGAPANRGLLDQVAALAWVRDNIAAFGGDAKQVTIFGESAGAGSIAALMAMPSAKGLFQRAIAQSVPGTFMSTALALDITRAIAAEIGLQPTLADLREVAPDKLVMAGDAIAAQLAQYEARWGVIAHTITPFSPVVDGDNLPTTPWQAIAGGMASDVELIVGHNRDEYRLFTAMAGQLGRTTDEQAAIALRAMAPGAAAEAAYQARAYGADKLYERIFSDWLFDMPTLHLADAHTAGGGRAYLYQLTWPAPVLGGMLGACHGLDVGLVFGNFGSEMTVRLMGEEISADALSLSSWIQSRWIAFATSGNPGWPAYEPAQRLTQMIDIKPDVAPYPAQSNLHLWEQHRFAALALRTTSG